MQPEAIAEAVTNPITQNHILRKARQVVRRSGFRRSELDDIRQDLTTYLIEHLARFDRTRGSLASYIVRLVETRVCLLIRDRVWLCRAAGYSATSTTQVAAKLGPITLHGEGLISEADAARRLQRDVRTERERGELNDAVAAAVAALPDDVADLCRSVASIGVSATADQRGVSRRQIEKVLRGLRPLFEAKGLDAI